MEIGIELFLCSIMISVLFSSSRLACFRTALLQELDRIDEEVVQVRVELDKAKSLL
jgi:hypothetical protein